MYSSHGSPGLRGIFGSGSAFGKSRFDRVSVVQLVLIYVAQPLDPLLVRNILRAAAR